LAVTLGKHNGIVVVVIVEIRECDVVNTAATTSTLEVAGERSGRTGPDLNTRTVLGVAHGDVTDEDVLNNVVSARILS